MNVYQTIINSIDMVYLINIKYSKQCICDKITITQKMLSICCVHITHTNNGTITHLVSGALIMFTNFYNFVLNDYFGSILNTFFIEIMNLNALRVNNYYYEYLWPKRSLLIIGYNYYYNNFR